MRAMSGSSGICFLLFGIGVTSGSMGVRCLPFIARDCFPIPKATFAHWREVCRREGLGEIYLAGFKAFDFHDPAAVRHGRRRWSFLHITPESRRAIAREFPVFNDFEGAIYDYRKVAENFLNYPTGNFTLFRGVMPSWDNTARRQKKGTIWAHSDPQLYCRWLHRAVLQTRRYSNPDERLIFINSWNEWAEGAHLEPDERYGYAWLNATRLALEAGSSRRDAADNSDEPYVLVISHDAALAGAQVLVLNLLRQWKKRRPFAVRVICVGDGELRKEFEKCFPTLVLADFAAKAEQDHALVEFLKGSPRVIYSSTVVNGPLLAQLRSLGAKIVTHSHELQKSIERWAPGEIMAATLKHSDFFLGGSAKVAENLAVSHGVPKDRLDVVYGFIEPWEEEQEPTTAAKAAMREELGIGVEDVVVFGCGTTDWRKGPDLFLEIARLACARDARLKFVWIGGDPAPFMEKVRSAGLEGRVFFVGNRKESRRYYYVGHIFLLSSREDPCPLVALEAANAGLPVVCFADAGDIPDFVGEECGAVVPYEDVRCGDPSGPAARWRRGVAPHARGGRAETRDGTAQQRQRRLCRSKPCSIVWRKSRNRQSHAQNPAERSRSSASSSQTTITKNICRSDCVPSQGRPIRTWKSSCWMMLPPMAAAQFCRNFRARKTGPASFPIRKTAARRSSNGAKGCPKPVENMCGLRSLMMRQNPHSLKLWSRSSKRIRS